MLYHYKHSRSFCALHENYLIRSFTTSSWVGVLAKITSSDLLFENISFLMKLAF
jgi:hypothetical protein